MPEPDEALIADLKSGDLDAYRELYERHRDRMLRVATRILPNRADAEDAVQEAFVILYSKVGSFGGRSSFVTWFYRIVVNACLKIRKKRARAHEIGNPEALEAAAAQAADRASGCGADPALDEAVQALDREIALLPLRQRTVFSLSMIEGFSLKETARILGLKAGTARYHLFMARDRLRVRLRPFLGERFGRDQEWIPPSTERPH